MWLARAAVAHNAASWLLHGNVLMQKPMSTGSAHLIGLPTPTL